MTRREQRIPRHPGISLSTATVKELQTISAHWRRIYSQAEHKTQWPLEHLHAIAKEAIKGMTSVLEMHWKAIPGSEKKIDASGRKRIVIPAETIGLMRSTMNGLYYALSVIDKREPFWNHHRMFRWGEDVIKAVSVVLRMHRTMCVGGPIIGPAVG